MKVGVIGNSHCLKIIFGTTYKEESPLNSRHEIRWTDSARGELNGQRATFLTSPLLDENATLRSASRWVSTEELDLIVLVFSALSDRCFMSDPAFSPVFAWSENYFVETRQRDPQIGVLIVAENAGKNIIGTLVSGDAYLTKLMVAGRMHMWPARLGVEEAEPGTKPSLTLQMTALLDGIYAKVSVSRLGRRSDRVAQRRARMQFISGLVAGLTLVLFALLILHLTPSLQGSTLELLLPSRAVELQQLRSCCVELDQRKEELREAREKVTDLERQNNELQQILTTANKELEDVKPMAEAKAALCAGCCSQATRPLSCTHWCTSPEPEAVR